jgi:hypothetical protein
MAWYTISNEGKEELYIKKGLAPWVGYGVRPQVLNMGPYAPPPAFSTANLWPLSFLPFVLLPGLTGNCPGLANSYRRLLSFIHGLRKVYD